MPDDRVNPPIDRDTCMDCGSEVVTRRNKNWRLYYHCPVCKAHGRFSTETSRRRIAAAAAASRKGEPAHAPEQPAPAPGAADELAGGGPGAANDNDAAGEQRQRRRAGGLFGLG